MAGCLYDGFLLINRRYLWKWAEDDRFLGYFRSSIVTRIGQHTSSREGWRDHVVVSILFKKNICFFGYVKGKRGREVR